MSGCLWRSEYIYRILNKDPRDIWDSFSSFWECMSSRGGDIKANAGDSFPGLEVLNEEDTAQRYSSGLLVWGTRDWAVGEWVNRQTMTRSYGQFPTSTSASPWEKMAFFWLSYKKVYRSSLVWWCYPEHVLIFNMFHYPGIQSELFAYISHCV
jgi:hypothetical protein